MPPVFHFAHELPFTPATPGLLRALPEAPGLLALFPPEPGPADTPAQPFLTRTANLRRRAERLLNPPPPREQQHTPDGTPLPSRRLNLRDRVATVRRCVTGSDWASLLVLYQATASLFGLPEARRRLRLHTPFFVRFAAANAHPRVYVSNRLARVSLPHTFGPFPSRLAAERYTDAVLDLFHLRRCWEDLVVHPDHPGCAYGEMKKCLAPCNLTCTPEAYAAESAEVLAFLQTNGASLLSTVVADRDQASLDMDFERAADLHRRHEKVRAATALRDPLIAAVPALRALIVQPAAPPGHEPPAETHAPMPSPLPEAPSPATAPSNNLEPTPHTSPDDAALFLLHAGELAGPARLSTLGVRAVREQTAVGSSLFAQPLMLAAVPLAPEAAQSAGDPEAATPNLPQTPPDSPETRAKQAGATLENTPLSGDPALLSDHLALLRRWAFRPEKQRTGELLLPNPDGSWPLRRLLNAAARTVLGDPKPMQATVRDAAKDIKTKQLHPGREGVERTVPVLPRRPRASRARPAPTDKLPLS